MSDTYFERFFQGYYTAERKHLLYSLTGQEKQHGSGKLLPPGRAAGRVFTFIVIGRSGRSERFWWKYPKYERPFSACRTSRGNKTDAAALYFENAKYTMRKILAQKYPLALQKCTLSGKAGG